MAKIHQFVILIFVAVFCEGKPTKENYLGNNERDKRSMDDEQFHTWLEQMERNFNEGFDEYVRKTEYEDDEEETRKKREDEKDPFQSFMETMQGNFDKDFDEFMKEMEKGIVDYGDDDDKTKRDVRNDSIRDQTIISTSTGKSEYTNMGRADSFDDFLISVDREVSGDFGKFLNDLSKLESSGSQKRETSKKVELFDLWKENERRNALQEYELFKNQDRRIHVDDGRNLREAKEDRVNISSPVPEPQADQLLASAAEATEVLTGNENSENSGEGAKAEESSSKAEENSSNGLIDMIPAPFKDKIPGMVSSSPESPTLFIGGFSVMMMPMPNGSDMFSLMQQGAPSFMNFMQMVPTGK